MSLKGRGAKAAALVVVGLTLVWTGCGDLYRPVANPLPCTLSCGDPERVAHALVLSTNGSASQGTAVIIDVSGDTMVGSLTGDYVGRNPVNAVANGGFDYVANLADDNVVDFTVPAAGIPLTTNKISLNAGAMPVFLAVGGGKVFVAESGLATVEDIGNSQSIPVGNTPVALVATPDGTQLYAVNQGDNPPTVSVIFPSTDQNVATLKLPAGAKPVWGAVSADGTRVAILNQGTNSVTVIDTVADAVIPPGAGSPCTQDTFCVGAGPNYIYYEGTSNRFYVTSPADNSLTIINNGVDAYQCAATPSMCVQTISMAGPPCNGQHPVSVTALADGSRAYVADDVTNSVCVMQTSNNAFSKSIPVGTAPVFIASDPNSIRVYTANSGSGNVSLIETVDDMPVAGSNGPLTISTGGTPTFIAITP